MYALYLQPVGNPWWNLNVQQLQPTFTQAQFNQAQTGSVQNENTNVSVQSSNQSTQVSGLCLLKDWNSTSQTSNESDPIMDICTDDAFIGGSSLKLQADVVHSKFVMYR